MYLYILDKATQDWIESEDLYPTDIALLIDNEKRMIYLYNGFRSSKKNQQLGKSLALKITQKYEIYKFEILTDIIPIQLQVEIDLLMGDRKNENNEKEPRTPLLLAYPYLVAAISLATLFLFIEQSLMLKWSYIDNAIQVTEGDFSKFFSIGEILSYILIVLTGILIAISISTKKLFLIGSSLASEVMSIGFLLYVSKREFLFSFIPETPYRIDRFEILGHLFWVLLYACCIIFILCFSSFRIFKETQPVIKQKISLEEMQKKSRPTILQDKEPVKMTEIEE